MSRTIFSLALPLALLAACQEQPSSVAQQNDERDEAAAETVPDSSMLKPGRWETKTLVTSLGGATPEARQQANGKESALDQCLPEKEARRPDANFFAGGDGSECEYTSFTMRDGRLDARMSCTVTPGTMTVSLAGSYTPTSYALDATASTSGTPGGSATDAKLSGTWIGPCNNPSSQRAPEERAR
jgi:hypothetical protein